MIRCKSEKLEREWVKAPVALRLVAEALDLELGGISVVFRIDAPTKFENGTHSTGRALDIEAAGSEDEIVKACARVNARFYRPKDHCASVCSVKTNLANFPSGAQRDRPHVHVEIAWDWKLDPRAFLRAYGYLES